jgi:hypothetical protein
MSVRSERAAISKPLFSVVFAGAGAAKVRLKARARARGVLVNLFMFVSPENRVKD